jgi:hypothetical protein
MPEAVSTCAGVEEGDYEARYLADRLTPAEAAAYEAHYFGCERCWASLRRATEARAAFAAGTRGRRVPRVARWALPLAAALVAVAIWRLAAPDADAPVTRVRGVADALTLSVVANSDSIHAVWQRQPDADRYRVRGFGADGVLVWSLETTDTSVTAARDGAGLVDVAALDRLRVVVMQSRPARIAVP